MSSLSSQKPSKLLFLGTVERPVSQPAATDLPKVESGIAKGGTNDGDSGVSGTQTRSFDSSPTGKGDSTSSGKEGALLPSSED
jgi:hypothetical protein